MKKLLLLVLPGIFISCNAKEKNLQNENRIPVKTEMEEGMEKATLAGGCFWCTEAVFLEIDGIKSAAPGYIGGKTTNPTYKEICNGDTGHAEAIEIVYDPSKVSYGELLEVFFATHDPTTLNRQGNDVGTQYRSEIFYHNDEQKQVAEKYIDLLNSEGTFGKKIVTKVSPATIFYAAEDYHKNYYSRNKDQSYCNYVITPKIDKVRTKFKDKLKQQ